MKVLLYLLLLSVCALGNAGVTYKNVVGNNALHSLGPLELHMRAVAPVDESLFLEDYLVAEFNRLDVNSRSLIAGTIKNILEEFREVVINGNDDIPPLDPLVVDQIGPFLYTDVGVRGQAEIRNLRVEGLAWYVVDDVTVNSLRLTLGLQVTIPRIVVTGSYDASASILLLTHRAGGNFRVFVHRLEVGVDTRLGTNIFGGHLVLRQLNIKIDIHDTLIQIEGMVGSSVINNFINALVQSVTQEVIQSQLENVSQILSEQLFDVINEFLKDFTLNDLLS